MLGLFDIARGADAIADDATQSLHQRRLKIAALREALLHNTLRDLPVWALVHARDISRGKISAEYAMHLLDAFLSDTFTTRYQTIGELERYCLLSTASLGRGFLAIAGETGADTDASDALCVALQLLNHWRDLGEDARVLDRIYLPRDWITAAGAAEQDLRQDAPLPAAWMNVLADLDAHIARLLERASLLAPSLKSRRLRFHTRLLWNIANEWHRSLQGKDVLRQRISPTRQTTRRALLHALRHRPQ